MDTQEGHREEGAIMVEKGWRSDSLRIKNRHTQIKKQELKPYSNTLTDSLQFQNCPSRTLISEITQLRFPNLISINLQRNQLGTIEGLCNLDAPALKEIRLCYNNIVSVRNLRRGHWPNLLFLNLKENKICEYERLSEMKMANGFESLTLATRRQSDKTIKNDITWLAKLQPNKIFNINVSLNPNEPRRHYYYDDDEDREDEREQSLEAVIRGKIKRLKKKFQNQGVFDYSNCYDLH